MPKIFISYRRSDTNDFTHLVYMLLKQLGNDVYIDVENIPVGVDFRQYLKDQIAGIDVVLVIIGQQWGELMLKHENSDRDFVRIEIENAFDQGKLVIPVLIKDNQMPDFSSLPDSIQALQWINAARIRDLPYTERDCEYLFKSIENALVYKRQQIKTQPLVGKASVYDPLAILKPDVSILPEPFEWIHIPNGSTTIIGASSGYIKHGRNQKFDIEDFYISKYPITNMQYSIYVAETANKPRFWENTSFNQQYQPVVGVSWEDAINYCKWLSVQLGYKVTLPTEQQWQRAAQGDENRLYPWGNQWNSRLCNANKYALKTTSVNQFPDGSSVYGVCDMSGNVWEWCLTAWENGSQDIDESNVHRILRGGSWLSLPKNVQVTVRIDNLPHHWYDSYGFRIVRAYL